jgi:outer membrane biogenesis lipoprotein LolB
MTSRHIAFSIACLVLTAGCGARRIPLPTDTGSPLPNYSDIHAEVTKSCRGARTLTAELGLRGRAGTRRLSGRLIAGFERPASMRLEAVAPFGPAGFILVTRGEQAVLLLPRDERVVRGESAQAILGALTGVTLGPADLQAILTGCILPESKPVAGRMHANGWASIDLEGGATIYLRRIGAWQITAGRRNGWEVEYPMWT